MCCGQNRALARAAALAATPSSRPAPHASPAQPSAIVFEYAGIGSASIRGPVTGQTYRFARPGDRVRVDPRDRVGLSRLSSLRWIR
jgi:hypothetical protein